MSFDDKFKKEITNFERYGAYTYKFDEVGNVIFNSASNDFSEVYISLPLYNFVLDNAKIEGFYDPTFKEFLPTTQTVALVDVQQIKSELEVEKAQNVELNQKLNELIGKDETSTTEAEKTATKQVILELRKQLGQGRVDSDFSEDFPYSALRKTKT